MIDAIEEGANKDRRGGSYSLIATTKEEGDKERGEDPPSLIATSEEEEGEEGSKSPSVLLSNHFGSNPGSLMTRHQHSPV